MTFWAAIEGVQDGLTTAIVTQTGRGGGGEGDRTPRHISIDKSTTSEFSPACVTAVDPFLSSVTVGYLAVKEIEISPLESRVPTRRDRLP